MKEEAQSLSNDDMAVVGYTTDVDGIRFTGTIPEVVSNWLGKTEGATIEPVVLQSQAAAKINELSDLATSLSETQLANASLFDILEHLEKFPPGFIMGDVTPEALADVEGNLEVTSKVVTNLINEGIKEVALRPELIFVPHELDQNTKELVITFAQSLMMKLLKAKEKYGYTDGWRQGYEMSDCQQDFADHVLKGDPRDVAAFCAFLWYHGWKTNGDVNENRPA